MSLVVTSHSRLGVYETCPQKYHREYNLNDRVRNEADHFIIGTLCHEAIEAYWGGEHPSVMSALADGWTEWLRSRALGHLRAELQDLNRDIAQLWKRASADYHGSDRIRKAQDMVADNPTMTKAWKEAVVKLNLEARSSRIDQAARQMLGEAYKTVSVVNSYAESHVIMSGFKDPACLASVEYIEFPLSERVYDEEGGRDLNGKRRVTEILNPVQMPLTGTYLNGYIDVVGKGHNGRVILLDHKTSSGPPPSVTAVQFNEQLLQYDWAWFMLTGEWPEFHGINHLRSGTCVIAPVIPEAALEVIARREQLILAQQAGIYPKKDPFAYGSPCLKMRDGQLQDSCPHLAKCHPRVAQSLGLAPQTLSEGL